MKQMSAHAVFLLCQSVCAALLCPGGVLVEDNVVSHNYQQGPRPGQGHIESLQRTRAQGKRGKK